MRSAWQEFQSDESGGVAVIVTIALTAMLCATALVLDLGHLYTVKTEVRKAAEAGACAGARALALPKTSTSLNWANGKDTAVATVQQNAADNRSLADFTVASVQAGYWDMSWTSRTAPADLLGSADPASFVPTANQIPAVKVTVAKTPGGSGSSAPVATSFASVMGISSMGVQGSAVAILPAPTGVSPGDCFPMATPEGLVKAYWDQEPPVSFRIGSSYHTPDGGQWTSFLTDANNVPTIRDLIANGNPTCLNVGDPIWIEPGTKTTLFADTLPCVGKTYVLPVVCDNFDTHAWTPIKAFVSFYIEDAVGGSGKYIQGHFVKNSLIDSGRGAGGSYYGVSLPPKLVQ